MKRRRLIQRRTLVTPIIRHGKEPPARPDFTLGDRCPANPLGDFPTYREFVQHPLAALLLWYSGCKRPYRPPLSAETAALWKLWDQWYDRRRAAFKRLREAAAGGTMRTPDEPTLFQTRAEKKRQPK